MHIFRVALTPTFTFSKHTFGIALNGANDKIETSSSADGWFLIFGRGGVTF